MYSKQLHKLFLIVSIIVPSYPLLGMEDAKDELSSEIDLELVHQFYNKLRGDILNNRLPRDIADEVFNKLVELAQKIRLMKMGQFADISETASDLSHIMISTECNTTQYVREAVHYIDGITGEQDECVVHNPPLVVQGVIRLFLGRLRELEQDDILRSRDEEIIADFDNTQKVFKSLAQSMQLLGHYEVAGMLFMAADVLQQASKIMQDVTHSDENVRQFVSLVVRLENFAFLVGIRPILVMDIFMRMKESLETEEEPGENAIYEYLKALLSGLCIPGYKLLTP